MQNSRSVLGRITVLIVDDTAINRMVVPYSLSECTLLEAVDGETALDLLEARMDIPLGARIIGICDVFDALASDHPFRKRITNKDALWYIQDQSGLHFDPELARVFTHLIQDYR